MTVEAVLREYGSAGFLLAGAGVDSHVISLLAYIAFAWGFNWLMVCTIIAEPLATVKFYRGLEHGLDLFLRHPWIGIEALKGVTRSHIETGTKSRAHRTLASNMLLVGESWYHRWELGGRDLCLAVGTPFMVLARTVDMFASKEGRRDDGQVCAVWICFSSGTVLKSIGHCGVRLIESRLGFGAHKGIICGTGW